MLTKGRIPSPKFFIDFRAVYSQSNIEQKVHSSHIPCPPKHTASPTFNISYHCGTLDKINKTAYHNQQKSIVYIINKFGVVHSMSFHTCVITHIHMGFL